MVNVYLPGDTVFLYAAFQKNLNLITEKNASSERTTGALKNGIYINGEYISYEDYMTYYDTTYSNLIDTSTYAVNSYYNTTLGQYYNYVYPYYINALEDHSLDKADIIEVISHTMDIRILHDEDGEIFEDLEWTHMLKMSDEEYYYNFCIPYDFTPGQYQVVYRSIYSKKYLNNKTKAWLTDDECASVNLANETKTAYTRESFYVVIMSDVYENIIKVFGDVNYKKTTIPAEDVRVSVYETNTPDGSEKKIYQSLTDRDGYWEAYLYPNQYHFIFSRNDYQDEHVYAEISPENRQQPFETISLGKSGETNGNGLYHIFDTYVTKIKQPIYGLTVTAYAIEDPSKIVATTVTNDKGYWELFLNDGVYLLKVTGEFNSLDWSRTFRLKVTIDGEFFFEGLMKNILTDDNINTLGPGTGKFKIKDNLSDHWGNPIPDIQVNIYDSSCTDLQDEYILAQNYSDGNGNYTLYLTPGTYIFEYYHPNYVTYTEKKIVDADGNISLVKSASTTEARSVSDDSKTTDSTSLYNPNNAGSVVNAIIHGYIGSGSS